MSKPATHRPANKVISLTDRARESTPALRLLADCRELLQQRLVRWLREVAPNIAEELFVLADATRERQEQTRYLDLRAAIEKDWGALLETFRRDLAAEAERCQNQAGLPAADSKPPPELPRWLLQRTLGHWVGLLLAGVPLLTLRRDALLRAWAAPRRAWTLLLLITLLCSTLAVVGFSAALGTLPWLLACIPMVLLAALLVHTGLGLAAAMTATLAVSVVGASGHGVGLFATLPAPQAMASAWASSVQRRGPQMKTSASAAHGASSRSRRVEYCALDQLNPVLGWVPRWPTRVTSRRPRLAQMVRNSSNK